MIWTERYNGVIAMIIKCKGCEKEFEYHHPSHHRQFCSRGCRSLSRKKYAICPVCQNTFEAIKRSTFCSVQCRDIAHRRDRICLYCGKSYHQQGHGDKYCSWDCFQGFLQNRIREAKPCAICGEPIQGKRRKYCSYICMGKAYRIRYLGQNNPNWRGRPAPDYGTDWDNIRKEVFERDRWQCRKCGQKGYIEVHHIVSIRNYLNAEFANDKANLITLCRACHNRTHTGVIKNAELRRLLKISV